MTKDQGPPQTDGHILALDGVRGLAIALVVSFHSGLLIKQPFNAAEKVWMGFASIGWSGVDLFFVLSGFLITTILIQTREDERYFRNFFMRRVLRIFPLYFGALLLILSRVNINDDQIWYWLFAQNWLPVFGGGKQLTQLQPFWSLAVEEQFYLVWPLVIFWLRPKHVPVFCVLIAVAALVARCVAKSNGVEFWTIATVTPFRLDALAMGALVACLRSSDRGKRILKAAPAVLVASLIGLCVVGYFDKGYRMNGQLSQTAGYTLYALMSAGLIAMIAEQHALCRTPRRLLESKYLCYLGNRSYAIYLLHMPVLMFMNNVYSRMREKDTSGWLDVQCFFFGVCICLILAEVSWQLYERQFLKLKRRYPRGSEATQENEGDAID